MIWWLPLAAIAYGIFAITGAVDKTVVTNKIKNPLVASFWVSVFGIPSAAILLVGLLPFSWAVDFRFQLPATDALFLIAGAGISLQLALLFSFMSLKTGEATRVTPTIGAASPVFALIFALLILDERLSAVHYLAFGLLLLGAVLIAARPGRWGGWWFWFALASGAAGAFQSVLVKVVYGYNHFISSLALLGLGNIIFCLTLVTLAPAVRAEIAHALKRPKRPHRPGKRLKRLVGAGAFLLFLNNLLGSVGVIILNLSLKLGPVSLVNALKGLQYVGIFLIAILLSRSHPKFLREELTAQTVAQKLLAIGVIGLGVGLLVVTAS